MTTIMHCKECGKVFDMLNPSDVEEWSYGHDCEDQSPLFTRDN